ncbi:hypothetical protein Tco_1179148 [Tanacetum coccineum]
MADSSSHKPSSPEITPKEEPVTLDKPESPNPFLLADQVEFIFEEIAFTTNNEVALLYPSHLNSDYFREVSDFISKCCLNEAFIRGPTQYKEYLSEFWFISLLLEYMMLEYDNKELTIKPTQVFSVHNWALKPNQTEGPPFTDHMKAICNLDMPMDPKAPKLSSQTKEVPQGKKPRAKSGLKRKQSSKHTSESKTEASKSKTGQSEKETQSSSAKDKIPSHPSPPTPVVGEINKEGQQEAGGPTSLGATRYDASTDSTTKVDPGLSALNDSITLQQGTNEEFRADEISKKIKLEDLSNLLKDTRSAFFTPDSLQDEPIIVLDESEEEEVSKDKDTHESSHDVPKDTSTPHPPSPKSVQIQELMAQARSSYPDINQLTNLLVTSLKPELSKLLASHNFASFLPTKPKELPSKFTELSGEIKELKQHVKIWKSSYLGT